MAPKFTCENGAYDLSDSTVETTEDHFDDFPFEEQLSPKEDIIPRAWRIMKTKSVSFGNIEVREYPMVLGDNPSCRDGLPVSLGWEYAQLFLMDVDDYEDDRPRRRCLGDLVLSWMDRRQILKQVASIQDLSAAITKVQKTQLQRERSIRRLKYQHAEEFAESLSRKCRRVVMFGRATCTTTC
jgi:hypothetical protein